MARPLIAADHASAAERAVALLLRAIGEDPEREGLQRTPERVASAMAFLNSGAEKTPVDVLSGAVNPDLCDETVLVRGIQFVSLCERHLLPFHGRAHIAYLPAGRVIGRSALPRLVDVFARRLQTQQRLTEQVAHAVQQEISPRGVAVHLEGAHSCMMMRGLEKQESITLTSSFLGAFDRDLALRQEFHGALGACPPDDPGEPRETVPPAGVLSGESAPVPRGRYPQPVPSRARAEVTDDGP